MEPLLVDVKTARRMLGNVSNNTFWRIAKTGGIKIVGTARKRWVTVESLKAHVAALPVRTVETDEAQLLKLREGNAEYHRKRKAEKAAPL